MLRSETNSWKISHAYGRSLISTNDFDEASKFYENAVKSESTNFVGYAGLAELNSMEGK